MGTYRVLACEATTGIVKGEIYPREAPSWSTEICTKGEWGFNVDLGQRGNSKTDILGWTLGGAHFFAVLHDEHPLQAGFPSSAGFKQSENTFSVSGAGVGAIFDNREVRTPNGQPATILNSANDWTISNASQRAVMREILVKSLGDSDSGAALPFRLNDGAGETGTLTRTYLGKDLTEVWKRLSDETETDNGTEFIFKPYLFFTGQAPSIGWELKLGTPALGNLNLNAVWELSAAIGNTDVDYNLSIPRPHRVWAKGSGDGSTALIGYAENTAALQAQGIPYADYVDTSHSDEKDLTKLNSYASAILKEYSVPKETWSPEVRIDGLNASGKKISPALGEWDEGDMPMLRYTKHPVIADGEYRRRIMGMSNGQNAGTVSLKIQELSLA
ncbi:hypothetical protein ACWEOE_28875 [Amycolatopsis sp. NPDC004368]